MSVPAHRATPAGIRFEAAGQTPAYISMHQHRQGGHQSRNRWSASPVEEYALFATSHTAQWTCQERHNWAVSHGLMPIGTNDECVAKFPRPSNSDDDRHGYPVSAQDHKRQWEHRPPPDLTSAWVASGLISELQKNRIDKGKV